MRYPCRLPTAESRLTRPGGVGRSPPSTLSSRRCGMTRRVPPGSAMARGWFGATWASALVVAGEEEEGDGEVDERARASCLRRPPSSLAKGRGREGEDVRTRRL